jgi:hypothetical protein
VQERVQAELQQDSCVALEVERRLVSNQQWVKIQQRQLQLRQQQIDQLKKSLMWLGSWIGSGNSAILFYLVSLVIYLTLGTAIGVNLPDSIACNGGAKSACYQLRWDKSKVVLPEQVDGIVKKYLKSLKKNHSRR